MYAIKYTKCTFILFFAISVLRFLVKLRCCCYAGLQIPLLYADGFQIRRNEIDKIFHTFCLIDSAVF